MSLTLIVSHITMPKQRPTKSAASGCSAEALSGDIHIDADDTGSHDAFVKRLLQVQQDAFQACLQSAIAEIRQHRRVDNFMRETTTSLTELRVSLQYTQTQVDELTAKQTNDNVDDLAKKLSDCEDTIAKVERTVDYQENQSRRCNLRFDGRNAGRRKRNLGAGGKKRAPRNDNIAGTSGNSSTSHDDRAGTPNGPHRIESPDHRGQIRPVQRSRAGACGGQEKTTSWNVCERRQLAENYGETQRTSPQNDESTRRREDRLPVV